MTNLKKVKNETEIEELQKLFPTNSYKCEFNIAGELIKLESDDVSVVNHAKTKGLV
jgi:hypothetical protein